MKIINAVKKVTEPLSEGIAYAIVKKHFGQLWTTHLTRNARTYIGMFSGIQRLADGTAKKPDKIIKEWCTRTRYNFEESEVNELCMKYLLPLCEQGKGKLIKKWAVLLLDSSKEAGITKETAKELVLDEANVNAYIEWDGEELYTGDRVEIILPAWYLEGNVLEQGNCKKISE
ncbi:MAG: hypothetical protein Q4B31_03970 [Clostridia bacterium]|nr:hypothetical protein [Clostridia bacterium]